MSRIMPMPLNYKNAAVMHDYNELQIRIKTHLFDLGNMEFKLKHPKPTNEEIDLITNRIMKVLKEDAEPFIKK